MLMHAVKKLDKKLMGVLLVVAGELVGMCPYCMQQLVRGIRLRVPVEKLGGGYGSAQVGNCPSHIE